MHHLGCGARFTSQLDGRGTTFKWMWIDLKVETEFKDLFDAEMMPGVVVFNPHKRLRSAPDSGCRIDASHSFESHRP